jgi:transglutaminase-like putative cysteine protease
MTWPLTASDMKNTTLVLFLFCCFISIQSGKAQDQSGCIFGKITPADFNVPVDKSDSGAGAIILADVGKVVFEENEAGDFNIVLKRFSRVKIMSNNGFDAGKYVLHLNTLVPYRSIILKLPKPGLLDIKGITFNLENGVIKEEKLDPDYVYNEKEGKVWSTVKFAMPALKAGSVFDIEYTIRSAFTSQYSSWDFQKPYPCLWSEYDLTLPDAYLYTIKYQGDSSFHIHSVDTVLRTSNDVYYSGRSIMSRLRWVKTNEPALITEPYTGSWKNYVDRVTLLHNWRINVVDWRKFYRYTSESWQQFSKIYFILNGIENFETDKNSWTKKDVDQITAGLQTKTEIAMALFRFVRDHFKRIYRNSYFASQTLKETFASKTGNVADINLLLTAMLHQAKIEAEPAVLSTVDNGFGNLSYPLPEDYNYVICVAYIDGKTILLDASEPLNPFGKLLPNCYNGGAVTLNSKSPKLVGLLPDSLNESNRASVIITSDEQGLLSGSLTMNCGAQKSFAIREEVKKTSLKKYFNTLIEQTQIKDLSNEEAEGLDNPEKPLTIRCEMNFDDSVKSNIIYFNPVLYSYFKSSPFAALKRDHLVEMPYRMDNVYLLSMDIPKGYQVDEMPSSTFIHLNSADGLFEYSIEKNADNIQLLIRLKLNKTFFTTDEYPGLREFFNTMLKKESEQIVLRKINPVQNASLPSK